MNDKTGWDAFDDDAWPDEPVTGVRTPLPPFDLAAFAQESESRILAFAEAAKRPTAPPPPFHPSRNPRERSSSRVDLLPAGVEATLLECARRTELTRAQLHVGEMSREEAARVIHGELGRIDEAGAGASSALGAMARALAEAVLELGGASDGDEITPERHVLVLEDDPTLRDRVTVAVEALGFRVRAAAGQEALTELVAHDTPGVVILGDGMGGGSNVWEPLRGMLPLDGVPLVVGGRATGAGIDALICATGADDYVRFDLSVADLVKELGAIFTALGLRAGKAALRRAL
jgi:CheY-like chemotaxis protein